MARNLNVIVGLGGTGLSCARYFNQLGQAFAVIDSRPNPPNLTEFKTLFPHAPISTGKWDDTLLMQAEKLIMSPGVSLHEPAIAAQIAKGTPAIGDIELFVHEAKAPLIAITGTNAKSTVTTLVGEMAATAKKQVKVGGNLGIPALDLLSHLNPDLYVLELSSFQLETTPSITSNVATVLNITPDHMDRYDSLEKYCLAKQHIYSQCEIAVCNRDDPLTYCQNASVKNLLYFTLDEPKEGEFGIRKKGSEAFLAFQNQLLLPIKELPILGRHYQANALAALAIGYGYGLAFDPMLQTLCEFKGLPHRCQLVRERNDVRWYNDSKGTNVGATLAAIEGLGSEIQGKIILIAGGVGKNADFTPLVPAIEKYVKNVVLIGEAAPLLAELMNGRVDIQFAKTLSEAVTLADEVAVSGDSVLLSPACASFDMFKNFEHRGTVFNELVEAL